MFSRFAAASKGALRNPRLRRPFCNQAPKPDNDTKTTSEKNKNSDYGDTLKLTTRILCSLAAATMVIDMLGITTRGWDKARKKHMEEQIEVYKKLGMFAAEMSELSSRRLEKQLEKSKLKESEDK